MILLSPSSIKTSSKYKYDVSVLFFYWFDYPNMVPEKESLISSIVLYISTKTKLYWYQLQLQLQQGLVVRPLQTERWRITLSRGINNTRSSADADNRLDAFSGQSRSTNMVPFHMLHNFLLCNSNFVFKTCRFYDIRLQKNSWPWNGGQRSLKVIESGIIR